MTPNFALLLSSDGIVLLQRVAGGWQHAGKAALDANDLNAEMAALRATAGELESGDIRTLLLLPDDQIKYLSIDTARTSQDDIEAAVIEATPLALDEMRIDFDRSGGRTYIAAVAKQTLLEAETFAQEHHFAPVGFLALAEPYTFRHAACFGLTAFAEETLSDLPYIDPEDPDVLRTALRGSSATLPIAASPEIESQGAGPTEAPEELPVFVSRNRQAPTAVASIPSAPEAEVPVPQFKRSSASRPDRKPRPTVAAPARKPEPSSTAPKKETAAQRGQSELGLVAGLTAPAQPRRISLLAVAAVSGLAAIGGVGLWASQSFNTNIAGLFTLDPGLQEESPAPAAVITAEPSSTPVPQPSPAPVREQSADFAIADQDALEPSLEETPPTPIVTAIPGRVLSPADAARIYAATGVWQRAPRLPDRNVDEQGTLDGIHEFAVLPASADAPRPADQVTPITSHELPIIAPLNPAPLNRPLRRDADGFVLAPAVGTVLPTGVPIFGRAPSSRPPLRPTDEPIYLRDDSIPTVQLEVVTGIELVSYTVESAAPTVNAFRLPSLSQPQAVLSPDSTVPEVLAEDIAVVTTPADPPPPEPAPAIMDQIVSAVAILAGPTPQELVGTTFDDPSKPDTPLPQRSPVQAIAAAPDSPLSPPPLDNVNAPEGFVDVRFGRPDIVPPLRPTDQEFGQIPLAEASAVIGTRVALPPEPQEVTEVSLAPSPVTDRTINLKAPATAVAFAADDPFISPDASTAAETAVIVAAGPPNIVPPLRPNSIEQSAAETSQDALQEEAPVLADAVQAALAVATAEPAVYQDPALAGARPLVRPATLLPASARTFEAIPELAGARPTLRPAGLAPEPTPEPDEPVVAETESATAEDIASIVASIASAAPPSLIVAPTQRAIVLSPRPGPRPQNFARVVAAAQAITARQQPAPSTPTQTAAIVQTPQPQTAPATGGRTGATVARAATVDNAIRLQDMNLIGVYGKPGSRRALVRMPNGRFVKVEVGSSLDGGRVTAINDSALNFVKRGRTYALQLPAG
ncbi:MAG: hypothetical protein AAFQ64_03395 [Pseudomonadota bacterium]